MKGKRINPKNASLKSCQFFSKITCVLFCVYKPIIESKKTLKTLKIVGFSPCATRTNKNPNTIKLSKIGLRLSWSSRMGALDHNYDRSSFLRARAQVRSFLGLGARALVRLIAGLLRLIALTETPAFPKFVGL
jgi:hypothetical protein